MTAKDGFPDKVNKLEALAILSYELQGLQDFAERSDLHMVVYLIKMALAEVKEFSSNTR